MKITALTENITFLENINTEHGLSLFIETENHKILFDTGQTSLFAENAEKLGVDLSEVDLCFISHGHYDHTGGLSKFLEINSTAPIYINEFAFEPHFNGTERYIGMDINLKDNDRLKFAGDYLKIDDELEVFSFNKESRPYPTDTYGLNVKEGENIMPDDFRHEHYLLIKENEKRILISGCSHKGILNITQWTKPDILVGGFHFKDLDPKGSGKEVLEKSAEILNSFNTKYYTCHCTGTEQFEFLKKLMGDKTEYLSCGKSINL
ncbi:MAG: MBL fold metallo-hydrolase [Ruminococcus sp.]|nr:MBL fold metallo-hydrolase [Ruminococcus sp.]